MSADAGHPGATGCPDWAQLTAARDASPLEPAGWEEALRHLDGCARCRQAAVAADPLLAFRRLPPAPLATDEVEAMRLRVAALRGAARLAPMAHHGLVHHGLAHHGTWRGAWRALSGRHVAAAAVVTLALLAGGNTPQRDGLAAVAASAPPATLSAFEAALAAEPVLDELDQPFDHVVQWNGDDLSVVLVVDGRLGV